MDPSSIGSIKKFFNRLSSQALRYCDVVMGFSLEKTKNDTGISYSRIVPSVVREVDEAIRPKIASYRKAISPAFHVSPPYVRSWLRLVPMSAAASFCDVAATMRRVRPS